MKGSAMPQVGNELAISQQSPLKNMWISMVIIVCWLGLFWPTVAATVAIWSTSDTFAHGFMIFPIVVWLFWRDRQQFIAMVVNCSYLGAAVTLLCIMLWFGGQTLGVSVFSQLGLFGGIAASHWMVFGNEFAARYKFPLVYLMFSVPMGNTLIPLLQNITAEITVLMLQLSQIPVYFEGLYITIPTGKFEVAVACSGIRYLIASLAVGTLYAYLNFRKPHKQLIFILLALVVPIIANGIRAYLIVLIAYLSDMEYATGVDHLIYGWLFFGLVIGLMFYLGSFFADGNTELEQSAIIAVDKFNFLVLALVGGVATSLVMLDRNVDLTTPPLTSAALALPQLSDVKAGHQSNWRPNFEFAIAEFNGTALNGVEIYIAQFAARQEKGELVTSTNQSYDHSYWSQISQTHGVITSSVKSEINYVQLQLVNLAGQRRIVRYWYQVNGYALTNMFKIKLLQAWLSITDAEQKVYFLAVSVDHESDQHSVAQTELLLNQWLASHALDL